MIRPVLKALLLIAALLNPSTFAFAEGEASFDKLKLTELDGNAVMKVLVEITREQGWGTRFNLPGGQHAEFMFHQDAKVIPLGGEFLIFSTEKHSTYISLKFEDTQNSPIRSLSFVDQDISVQDFNTMLNGKVRIEPLVVDEEAIPLSKLDRPAKIKFEEDIRVGVLEDVIIFKHPTKLNTHIKITLKEKLTRARVIPKDKTFEINQIDFDKTTRTTRLTIDSKDIASIECVAPHARPFTTKEFYETMGSKASLIQNTDPPLPIN